MCCNRASSQAGQEYTLKPLTYTDGELQQCGKKKKEKLYKKLQAGAYTMLLQVCLHIQNIKIFIRDINVRRVRQQQCVCSQAQLKYSEEKCGVCKRLEVDIQFDLGVAEWTCWLV